MTVPAVNTARPTGVWTSACQASRMVAAVRCPPMPSWRSLSQAYAAEPATPTVWRVSPLTTQRSGERSVRTDAGAFVTTAASRLASCPRRRAPVARRGWSWLGSPDAVSVRSLAPVLTPGQPYQKGVENGQRGEPDREVHPREPVDLVGDERQQQGDQPGVRPQLVAKDESDEHDFGDAMAEQVDRPE